MRRTFRACATSSGGIRSMRIRPGTSVWRKARPTDSASVNASLSSAAASTFPPTRTDVNGLRYSTLTCSVSMKNWSSCGSRTEPPVRKMRDGAAPPCCER